MINEELALLRGKDYIINSKIRIKQPTLNDIFEYGEHEYFSMVSNLTATPSEMKSVLFDMGTDYETLSDFECFLWLCKNFNTSKTGVLFGDYIDFQKMIIANNPKNGEVILTDSGFANNVIIDFHIYDLMANYIRKMHGFTKTVEKAANEYTKKILIQEDRDNRKSRENKEIKSFLKPLIVSMVNCADFPYNFTNVWDLPISVFMESVQQIQKYKYAGNLLQGIYSGSIDGTKINKDDLRWI